MKTAAGIFHTFVAWLNFAVVKKGWLYAHHLGAKLLGEQCDEYLNGTETLSLNIVASKTCIGHYLVNSR